jgi:hypothetical protein
MSFPPPMAIPAGQSLVYCYATTLAHSAGFGCSASNSPTNGQNNQGFSGPLSNSFSQCDWSNFYVPPILSTPGTVVHGIYSYMVFGGSFTQSTLIVHLDGVLITGYPTSPYANQNRVFHRTGPDFTDLTTIPTMTAQVYTDGTLPIGPIADFFITNFLAIAVYATIPYNPPPINIHIGVGSNSR